ncbi:OmpA family protein [Anianabacter salinae]|uniref:OmpA family protein n=1 Tax=Anianabacter salinae TaxID=2851023 RepID=UPI00225DEAA9|nr:OmpA family protein [Anianabacter salinae]MBV0913822.1 OmpA family protein [Anianabacter salinae]
MTSFRSLSLMAGLLVVGAAAPALAGNREDCLQDADQALAARACPLYQAELAGTAPATAEAAPAASAETPAGDAMLASAWLLNPAASQISLSTTKNETVTESHVFTTLDGNVQPDGSAIVTIDLNSLDTSVDIRNVRMRFLFFETFKFPVATLTTQLDPAVFGAMAVGDTIDTALPITLDLHGVTRELSVNAVAVRMSDTVVRVVSAEPVEVMAADHDLTDGVARLAEAADDIAIKPSAMVSFDLSFEGGEATPELLAARAATETSALEESTRALSTEECDNRMAVISSTRAIYFASGSARIDEQESAPVLDEVAQFFNRCAGTTMQIEGHTDSDGGEGYNRSLSEQRAAAVLQALLSRDVDAARLRAAGFGESQPVADNTTQDGRAKNRRIEFRRGGA